MDTILSELRLRFHIENPGLEECYADGYESALAEKPEEDNPFILGSVEYEHWSEGWWAGLYGEKPLYALEQEIPQPDLRLKSEAANDLAYEENNTSMLTRVLEITGLIVVSAFIGYQLIEMVA